MKFEKNWLREMIGDKESTVSDEVYDTSRWSIRHARIFRHEGKFYRTCYSIGATEQQSESPYEYERDEVECPEVRPVEKTIVVYEPVTP